MPYPMATLVPSPTLVPGDAVVLVVQQIALGARRNATIVTTGPRTATIDQPERNK